MNILLVDNYDSFTWNVHEALARLGATVRVVRNDAGAIPEILEGTHDLIVLSPGPGRPAEAGICMDLVLQAIERGTPLFGICLGMQCIAAALGAPVQRLPSVVHGSATEIHHDAQGVFQHLEQGVTAGRYHSLVVAADMLPQQLVVTATTPGEHGPVLMGLRHRTAPVSGVQFHPESILTPQGPRMLANVLRDAADHRGIVFQPRHIAEAA